MQHITHVTNKKKKIVNIQKRSEMYYTQVRVVRCINKHYVIKNDAATANTQFITLLYTNTHTICIVITQ